MNVILVKGRLFSSGALTVQKSPTGESHHHECGICKKAFSSSSDLARHHQSAYKERNTLLMLCMSEIICP